MAPPIDPVQHSTSKMAFDIEAPKSRRGKRDKDSTVTAKTTGPSTTLAASPKPQTNTKGLPHISFKGDEISIGMIDGRAVPVQTDDEGNFYRQDTGTSLSRVDPGLNTFIEEDSKHADSSSSSSGHFLPVPSLATANALSGSPASNVADQAPSSAAGSRSPLDMPDMSVPTSLVAQTRPVAPATPQNLSQYPNSTAQAVLAAAATQAVVTGLTFGVKPFVEAGIYRALEELDLDNIDLGVTDVASLVSNMVGGAFVALVHNAVSGTVGTVVGEKLGSPTFVDTTNPEHRNEFARGALRREGNEILTVDLPVAGAFIGTFAGGTAMRTAMRPMDASCPFAAAGWRSGQSILGGMVQGAVTAAVKQYMSESYEMKKTTADNVRFAGRIFDGLSLHLSNQSKQTSLKHGLGKFLGSVGGMGGSSFAAPAVARAINASRSMPLSQDVLAQSAGAAVGMTTFLTSWFGGIHLGSTIGAALDAPEQNRREMTAAFFGDDVSSTGTIAGALAAGDLEMGNTSGDQGIAAPADRAPIADIPVHRSPTRPASIYEVTEALEGQLRGSASPATRSQEHIAPGTNSSINTGSPATRRDVPFGSADPDTQSDPGLRRSDTDDPDGDDSAKSSPV